MYTLEQFVESGLSFLVCQDGKEVFRSSESDLRPVVEFLTTSKVRRASLTVYDKYVGRAAALLITLLNPDKVYAGIISQAGADALEQHVIPYEAGEQVQYLMDVASRDMCRWEKMSAGKTPVEFFRQLEKTGWEEL